MGKHKFTIAPIEVNGVDPEFLDVKGVERRYSISRSLAYVLEGEGLIESVTLRREGKIRGKRLFSTASIRRYLASLASATSVECRKQAQHAVSQRGKKEVVTR
jgi:hypothetical protein